MIAEGWAARHYSGWDYRCPIYGLKGPLRCPEVEPARLAKTSAIHTTVHQLIEARIGGVRQGRDSSECAPTLAAVMVAAIHRRVLAGAVARGQRWVWTGYTPTWAGVDRGHVRRVVEFRVKAIRLRQDSTLDTSAPAPKTGISRGTVLRAVVER